MPNKCGDCHHYYWHIEEGCQCKFEEQAYSTEEACEHFERKYIIIYVVFALNHDRYPTEFYEFHKAFRFMQSAEDYIKSIYDEFPDLDKDDYKIEEVKVI